MILKIRQVATSGKNKYEITSDNILEYIAGSPWLETQTPSNDNIIRWCILRDTYESVIFSSAYNIEENALDITKFLKWISTGKQKTNIYRIYDKDKNEVGQFYRLHDDILDTKFIIDYNNSQFICYDKSVGTTRHLMIYQDELQIAEIVKPLTGLNNNDYYYIYLLDEYKQFKDILSFFVIFFDYYNQYSTHNGLKHASIEWSYSWDKNDKFYNKHWITQHFKKEDINEINQEISALRQSAMKTIKKTAKFTFTFCGILILLVTIVIGIVLLLS
ncbi:MAG: hypothetical protein IJW59_05155 [Clostridia bacterium]|nr:hypothetical protein [Clostridia bacterium]